MSSPDKPAIGWCWCVVLACSGHARDETRVEPPVDAPPSRVNAQRPAPAASGSAAAVGSADASDSGASAPELPQTTPPAPVPIQRDVDCQSGAERCNGARAERCTEGSWKLLQICAQCNGASFCQVVGQGASCRAPLCCFPEARCADNRLLRCNAGSTGFELVEDCGPGARCDVQSGKCLQGGADSGTGPE